MSSSSSPLVHDDEANGSNDSRNSEMARKPANTRRHYRTRRMTPPTAQSALFEAGGPKARRRIALATTLSLIALAYLLYLVINQFYISGQLDAQYWSFFAQLTTWTFLGSGLLGTLEVASVAGLIAIALGLILMSGRRSTFFPLRWLSTIIIEIARGVPSLLFIYFLFLVLPSNGIKIPTYWMLALPIAFNAGGVLAEVFRSGVNAVPAGQEEAATSLGLTRGQTFRGIILPQAIRYVIPTLITQLVVVLKDTTFGYVVSYPEMMQNANVLTTNYNSYVPVYMVTAVIYIVINYLLSRLAKYISHKTGAKIVVN